MNHTTKPEMPGHHRYRGYLASCYREYRVQHSTISMHDNPGLQTEFLKLAIQTWLQEAILPVSKSLEQWSQTARLASSEDTSSIQQVAQNLAEFAREALTFWKKINSVESTTFQLAVPLIMEWIKGLEAASEALDRSNATLDQEGQFLLSNWFLPRITELREDMMEVLNVLEEVAN
jgi:hypothetical protein